MLLYFILSTFESDFPICLLICSELVARAWALLEKVLESKNVSHENLYLLVFDEKMKATAQSTLHSQLGALSDCLWVEHFRPSCEFLINMKNHLNISANICE